MAARRLVRMQVDRLKRTLHVGDRLELLVLDPDALGRAARLLGMLGGDERDRLAVVENAVDREHRLIGELEPVGLLTWDVLVREHGMDARHRHRLGDVDRKDARVRMRASKRVPPQHPRHDEVARIRELALHLRRRVDTRDELADAAHLQRAHRLGHALAAARTASKIFA